MYQLVNYYMGIQRLWDEWKEVKKREGQRTYTIKEYQDRSSSDWEEGQVYTETQRNHLKKKMKSITSKVGILMKNQRF